MRELTALLYEAAGDRRSASQIRELVEWCYEQDVMTAVAVPENLLGDGVCTYDERAVPTEALTDEHALVQDYAEGA